MNNISEIFDDFLIAQISSDALISNLELLKSKSPDAAICAAVKANAYGHGVEIVAGSLAGAGVEMMAVSNFKEADQLLNLGIKSDILVLGSQLSIYRGAEKDKIARWIVENKIRTTPMTVEDVYALSRAAENTGENAIVHLKLDSGMSRMGLRSEPLKSLVEVIVENDGVEIEGVYTHFATADTAETTFTQKQIKCLDEFVNYLASKDIKDIYVHTGNSAAVLSGGAETDRLVRPGLGLYGLFSGPDSIERPDLKPVMKVISRLTVVKSIPKGSCIGYGCSYHAPNDMVIALVPIGYGDGYDRRLSNKGKMKIGEDYVSIVGRVSMDQTIVDVTGLVERSVEVKVGMEVTVIDDDPASENSVESLAKMLDTIPYEITSSLGPRIKRVRVD